MDLLNSMLDPELVKNIFGEAAKSEFIRTSAIFALAAWTHARQVRKEIKEQFGTLVDVLKADLDGQKNIVGTIDKRVAKIEERLQIKGE